MLAAVDDGLEKLGSAVLRFVRAFPQSALRARSLLLLARRQEAQEKDALAAQTYKQCLAVSGTEEEAQCAYRLGLLYTKMANSAEARTYLKKASALSSLRGSGAFFVAAARLELARFMDSEILQPKLTREGWVKELPLRLQAFEAVQKAYAPVLEGGGGFSITASRRLGAVALELASEMETLGADDPKIVTVVQTLRTTARQFFRQSLQKAQEGEWISADLPRLFHELSDAEGTALAQGPLPVLSMLEFLSEGQVEGPIAKLREQLSQNARDPSLWGRYALWLARELKNDELAAIAFDRVISLQSRNVVALNNMAVLKARSVPAGLEDDGVAIQALEMLKQAVPLESSTVVVRSNRAQILNFYAHFSSAKKIWEQVQIKDRGPLAEDGLGVSLQGIGNETLAKSAFIRARESGADPKRFAQRFHEAAAASKSKNWEACLDHLSGMRDPSGGFEKMAFEKLEGLCEALKKQSIAAKS